jgi:hypothetical protein
VDLVPLAGLVGMLAVVWKVIDFLRLAANWPTTRSSVVTQLLTWAGAVVVVFLYAASELGDFVIPGTELVLSDTNAWTKIVLALAIGSATSVAVDFKQAIDSTDSAAKPPLLE